MSRCSHAVRIETLGRVDDGHRSHCEPTDTCVRGRSINSMSKKIADLPREPPVSEMRGRDMCDCATRSVRFLIRGRVDEFNINRWRIMAIGPTLGIAPIGRG